MFVAETRAIAAAPDDSVDHSADWNHIIGSAEPFLQAVGQRLMDQIQSFDPEIAAYAEYALAGHGKRLRPSLVALSAGAVGQVSDAHITVAVIIEMVHLATLVHDDVVDDAEIRRGRPTLAAQWGNETSVLLGDCLFAQALKLAASFPTPDICRAVASATNTVCAGEILQNQYRHNFNLSRAEYFKVLQMKTGELFALSCDLGAYLGGAIPAHRAALRQFGMTIGTAYQVYDDCLDLFGSEAAVGKSLGTDLAKGKLTLPMLTLLEKAPASERARVQVLMEDWQSGHFSEIKTLLRKHQALEQSQGVVRPFLQAASQVLLTLPTTRSQAGLLALNDYLARQIDALRDSS